MKRKLSVLLITLMLAVSLTACAEKKTANNGDTTTPAQQTQEQSTQEQDTKEQGTQEQGTKEQDTQNESATPDNTADKNYATRINVSINPDADILTDKDGKVVEIVCNNDDATTAYGNLEVAGKEIEEVAKEMVKAATDAGFMQDKKPVTLTIVDAESTGQELMDEALEVKDGVQQALVEEDFQNAPIVAEIKEGEVHDDTCDLCYGKGLIICDGCNGTTFLDGNQWTVCGKCTGEGKTTCTLCTGEGFIACDGCGGTGLDANQDDGKCFACHGEGKTHCVRCGDGNGYQVCEDCNGEGRLGGLPCPRCGGTLWAMCHRCNGEGKNTH